MAGHVQRLSRYDEHQKQKLGSKEAMTALINPSYDSNADSPTDAVNANTTVSVSDVVTDVLANELKTMSMKLDGDSKDYTDSNLTVDNHDNDVKRRNSGTSGGKSRTKYASTDLSEMGIGDPLESLSDGNSQTDSDEGRLTVADDNILRERNKKKAEAMFADIDFIDEDGDDTEDDSEEDSEDEEDEDNSKDCEQEKNDFKRVKGGDVHVVEYDEQDDDEDDEDLDEDSDVEEGSGTGSPKDPDADVASPDDEVIAAKLGGFLSYYANLESLAKSRVDELDDDASINGSVSDSDLSENHEGLYEPPQHPTPYDSGPSTMDEESTDCESTYEMLYKSFGLRTQEEVVTKDMLSPMGGQPDHGYASETSTDDKTSPIKRPGLLVNESSKPSLSTLIEDSKASSPESHCSKLSPTTEAESGIEVTPEPKSNLEPILDSKKNTISKPTSLPPGWREVADTRGTYYWHVPSGTTQWSPPSPSSDDCSSPPKKPARTLDPQCSTSSDPSDSGRGSSSTEPDTSLQAFQQSTLRYANLQVVPGQSEDEKEDDVQEQVSPRGIRFHVRSLGWVEMEDSDLSPGKSSLAVNNCIRQLSYRKNDIRDTAGIWGEGKDMYMVLEDEYLKLTDPSDGSVLNSQHVCSIRVWGVGRDNGRDFAYVARDKVTKRYKCHVFRCDIPAKAIANALHEICARVMSERQKGHTISMVTQGQMIQQQQQLMQMRSISLDSNKAPTPTTAVDFPTPKAEPITVFRAHYVGNAFVPKHGGMETLNMAINKAFETIPEENWIPVRIEVAVSTVTVTNIKTKEIIAENRIRFLSFLGIGPDIRQFGYIMCIGKSKFQSHVFCCEHSAGGLAKAVEAACKLRYQKCLDARPKGHSYRSHNSENGKGWGGAIKNGVSSLFSKFKNSKEAPIAAV